MSRSSSHTTRADNQRQRWNLQLWTERLGGRPLDRTPATPAPHSAHPSTYHLGDRIVIRFRSDRDCYLTLLNLGSSGKLIVLFPNALRRDPAIWGGEDVAIPAPGDRFELELLGPPGPERLRAIATVRRVPLLAWDRTPKPSLFYTIGAESRARELGAIQARLDALASHEWSETSCEFLVV